MCTTNETKLRGLHLEYYNGSAFAESSGVLQGRAFHQFVYRGHEDLIKLERNPTEPGSILRVKSVEKIKQ